MLRPIAQTMDAEAEALERNWPTDPHRLFGTVRIAVGEWSGRCLMPNMSILVSALPESGDIEPGLERVSATIESLQTRIWLVYHGDSRNRPAVMALIDRLDDLFAGHRRLNVDHPDP